MRLLNGVVEFLSLRIAWSFDAKQMGDCRSNIDIINVEQSSLFDIRTCRVVDSFHFGQIRIISVLAKERRCLEQIADRSNVQGLKSRL